MTKSAEAFRTISEVAEVLETPAHVLRFWESRFPQVKPVKRAGGRRYYRPTDVMLLGGIKKLLHDEGLTIRGVQKMIRERGLRHVADLSPVRFDVEMPADEALEEGAEDMAEAAGLAPVADAASPARERVALSALETVAGAAPGGAEAERADPRARPGLAPEPELGPEFGPEALPQDEIAPLSEVLAGFAGAAVGHEGGAGAGAGAGVEPEAEAGFGPEAEAGFGPEAPMLLDVEAESAEVVPFSPPRNRRHPKGPAAEALPEAGQTPAAPDTPAAPAPADLATALAALRRLPEGGLGPEDRARAAMLMLRAEGCLARRTTGRGARAPR